MSTTVQTQLEQLQAGDRVAYRGVRWKVKEASTYADANGYETAEWLLRSPDNQEHYLLREVDPPIQKLLSIGIWRRKLATPNFLRPIRLRIRSITCGKICSNYSRLIPNCDCSAVLIT
jgi:hypothetical protein